MFELILFKWEIYLNNKIVVSYEVDRLVLFFFMKVCFKVGCL